MRNTIRKVTMVVLVLITSCQLSLKRNMGPAASQRRTMPAAMLKAAGLPPARDVALAKRVNHVPGFVGRIGVHPTGKREMAALPAASRPASVKRLLRLCPRQLLLVRQVEPQR